MQFLMKFRHGFAGMHPQCEGKGLQVMAVDFDNAGGGREKKKRVVGFVKSHGVQVMEKKLVACLY